MLRSGRLQPAGISSHGLKASPNPFAASGRHSLGRSHIKRGSTVAMTFGPVRETPIAETRWTAARLGRTLQRNISTGRLIVVSNREPCVHDVDPQGAIVASRPVSGLVS